LLQAAAEREWCYLDVPETLEATVASLVTCAEESQGPWLLANDLNPDVFPPDGPPRGFLDDIEAERPVWVSKAGGHEAYVNQMLLELAEIDASTPDPPNGTIVRDAMGRPTGTLRGAATTLVENRLAGIWPEPTPEDVQGWLVEELESAARLGVTSVQEIPGFGIDIAAVYDRVLDPAAGLPRVRFAQRIFDYAEDGADAGARIERAVEIAEQMEARGSRADVIKLFVDGDFPPQTAALTQPYAVPQEPGWRGAPYFSQEALNDIAARVDAAGLQLHFHAIGDRSIRMSLDAIEHARSVNGVRDARHQITHLHLTHSEDLHRFAELGVVANVQPIFADNHSYNTVLTRELLGPERNGQMHRFRDLLDAGADLVVSTDYPMILLEPLETIQTALTRKMPGSTEAGFNPEQRLSLAEVLVAYTARGAFANFMDQESGSLEAGKSADFVMFDRDLFAVEPDSLIDARVVWTVIRGRDTYGDPDGR
jgi:predicted amidohydrolase YtcJ